MLTRYCPNRSGRIQVFHQEWPTRLQEARMWSTPASVFSVEVILIMADMVDFDRGQNKCVCDVSLFHDGPFVPTQTNQIGQVRRIQEERSTRMHSLQAPRRLWRTPEYVSTFPAGLELMVRIR